MGLVGPSTTRLEQSPFLGPLALTSIAKTRKPRELNTVNRTSYGKNHREKLRNETRAKYSAKADTTSISKVDYTSHERESETVKRQRKRREKLTTKSKLKLFSFFSFLYISFMLCWEPFRFCRQTLLPDPVRFERTEKFMFWRDSVRAGSEESQHKITNRFL